MSEYQCQLCGHIGGSPGCTCPQCRIDRRCRAQVAPEPTPRPPCVHCTCEACCFCGWPQDYQRDTGGAPVTCAWCDEESSDLRVRPAGLLCPDCDRCSYCGKPPEGHYRCRDEQIEQLVCLTCQEDLEAGDEADRRERAYEAWVDSEIDLRKEERR